MNTMIDQQAKHIIFEAIMQTHRGTLSSKCGNGTHISQPQINMHKQAHTYFHKRDGNRTTFPDLPLSHSVSLIRIGIRSRSTGSCGDCMQLPEMHFVEWWLLRRERFVHGPKIPESILAMKRGTEPRWLSVFR
jgi:hypothetical protein